MFLRTILLLFLAANLSAQTPRLVLPIGHTAEILAVCFSPDGKYVATTSIDKSIKLWEAQTGMLLTEYNGHKNSVNNVAFSTDGKMIMSGDYDRVSKLWSVSGGTYISDTIYEWPMAKYSSTPQPFFNADKTKKGEIKDSVIIITDNQTGRELDKIMLHDRRIEYAFFSRDDKLLCASGRSYPTAILEIGSGKVILDSIEGGHLVFSPDSKKILVTNSECADCRFQCQIYNVRTGELLAVMRGYSSMPRNTVFGAADKSIISIDHYNSIRVWSDETATLLPQMHGKTDPDQGFRFSSDGKRMILPEPSRSRIRILDVAKGKLLKEIKWKPGEEYLSALLSPDESRVLTTSWPRPSAELWDVKTGKQLKKYTMADYSPTLYYFPGGKKFFIDARLEDMLCDATTGRVISKLGNGFVDRKRTEDDTDEQSILDNNYITAFACSPNEKLFATAAQSGMLRIYEASNGKMLSRSRNPDYITNSVNAAVNQIKFSPDNKRIATASWDMTAKLWDATNGKMIANIKDHHSTVNNVLFSPDGKELLSVSDTGAAIISSAADGKFIAGLRKPYNNLSDPSYSADGKRIITTASDNSINVWNAETYTLQYSFFQVDSLDYMYVLPSGYYKTTGSTARRLHYVTKDLDVMTFEQLDVKYNRPDKVLEATGSKNRSLIESYRSAYYKRLQKLGIDSSSFSDGYSIPVADIINRNTITAEQKNNTLNIHIQASDSIFKLDRFNVWINEVPLFGIKGVNIRKENKNDLDTSITIILSRGENKIETSITNVNGIESYRKPLLVKCTVQNNDPGKIYFIGVGINHFADSTHDLKWCVQDIRDLTTTMRSKYGNQLVIVDTLYNEKATRTNIRNLKKKLMNTDVNDKVIFSYSGHGLLSKDYDYYISSYTINFSNPEEGGIPYDEIENMLDSIPARKKILLLDACHSGEVDKEEMKKIQNASSGLSQNHTTINNSSRGVIVTNADSATRVGLQNSFDLMQSLFVNVGKGTGAIIISASGGVQFAQERSELGHGVFTYSVIEAMQNYSTIKVSELKKYIGNRVLELTNGLQKPTTRNETIAVDWNVW